MYNDYEKVKEYSRAYGYLNVNDPTLLAKIIESNQKLQQKKNYSKYDDEILERMSRIYSFYRETKDTMKNSLLKKLNGMSKYSNLGVAARKKAINNEMKKNKEKMKKELATKTLTKFKIK
jgi:hypothetical protein